MVSLSGGGYLLLHLGMTGRLLLGGALGKHTHAIFTLDHGVLQFDDSRQFGAIEVHEDFPARVARLAPSRRKSAAEDFASALRLRRPASRRSCWTRLSSAAWGISTPMKPDSAPEFTRAIR